MAEKVISRVKIEITQIDELFESYSSFLDKIRKQQPDLIEITACASVLHSYYNLPFPLAKIIKNTPLVQWDFRRWHFIFYARFHKEIISF